MLKRFTAAALSTVMCVSAALPNTAAVAAAVQSTDLNDSSSAVDYDARLQTADTLGEVIADAAQKDDKANAKLASPVSAETAEVHDKENVKKLPSAEKLTEVYNTVAAEDEEATQTGSLGENITFQRFSSGNVIITGHGAMKGSGNPFKNPETITSVVIENDGSAEGGITDIRVNLFKGCTALTGVTIPKTIETVGASAFEGCSSLAQITYNKDKPSEAGQLTLPASVTTIGAGAFKDCAAFTELVIPESVTALGDRAFEGCTGLTAINVPANVKTIGKNAFSRCYSAKTAVIAEGVETIGDFCFEQCTSLESLTLPYAATTAASAEKADKNTCIADLFNTNSEDEKYAEMMYAATCSHGYKRYVPKSLKTITVTGGKVVPGYAFYGLSGVETIKVPDTVATIGARAFFNCASLKSAPLPKSLSSIGERAFSGCKAITEINIAKTVTSIGNYAFDDCSALKTAVIAGGEKGIGAFMFNKCIALESLTLPFAGYSLEGVEKANSNAYVIDLFEEECGDYTYKSTNASNYTRYVPKSLEKITITGGTRLPNCAFYGLSGVKSFVIPDSVTEIGNNAFSDCQSLTENVMTDNITSVGSGAFMRCTGIKKAVFGKKLESVGASAFADCTALTEVTVPASVTSLGQSAFSGCSALKSAVIENCEDGIGAFVFDKCASLESITLPYAGYKLADVEKAGSTACLIDLFNEDFGDAAYKSADLNNYSRYVPKSLKTIRITGGTRLPNGAFFGFTNVENFDIADSVTSAGNYAFAHCQAIKDIFMNENVTAVGEYAYLNCTGLTDVTIPANVLTLGNYAFSGCSGLKNAVIEGGENGIGVFVFNKCASLESLTLPFAGYKLADVNKENSNTCVIDLFNEDSGDETYKTVNASGYERYVPKSLETIVITGGNRIPNNAFYGFSGVKKFVIPDSVTSFGSGSFQKCAALTENVMTDNITSIGDNAFSECTGLKKAVFGKKLANVGGYAFSGCTALTEVTVPETVTTLDRHAFDSCSALKTAEIKGKDIKLSAFIFNKCKSLEKLTLPFAGYNLTDVNKENSNANVIDLFDEDCGDETYKTVNASGYTRYVPKSLETIVITGGNRLPNYAFFGFSGVKNFEISDSVSSFGNYSFSGCAALEENVMTEKVASIGEHAFEKCTGMKDIYIGANVKSIGNCAFAGCTGLTDVTIPSTVSTVGNYAFSECSNLKNAVISDGVAEIGAFMFNKCSSLEAVTLPFAGYKLTDVNKENSNAYLIDLFNDDAGDSTYKTVSPSGYTRYVPKTLKSITITGGERIPNYAFANISQATDITVPNNIAYIGSSAFSGCEAVANVFFPDTKEKWDDVTVGDKNELIDGKVRWLNSDGAYVMPTGTMTTTTTVTTQRTTKATTTTATGTGTTANQTTSTTKTPVTTSTTKPVTTTTKTPPTTSATKVTGTSTATTTAPVTTTTTAPKTKYDLGDISGDGEVNAVDASMVLTYYAIASTTKDAAVKPEELAAGDVDGNGTLNATDASFILSYYAYAQTTKEKVKSMTDYMKDFIKSDK